MDGLSHLLPFETLVREFRAPATGQGANPDLPSANRAGTAEHAAPSRVGVCTSSIARIGRDLGHAKTDFQMELDQRPDGHLAGRFIYNTDIFDEDFGARVVNDWLRLLRELASATG